jgi:hypothetical protein
MIDERMPDATTLALMAARATQEADSYNRSPEVDQGGCYVYTTPGKELYRKLVAWRKKNPQG